jgi:hypothetical protein
MRNAMFLLLLGIAPAGVFPPAAGAVPDGAAHDGFRGRAAVIESAQIPQTEPDDFGPFPMSGEKKGCVETCSVNDAGYNGAGSKDASTHEGAESRDGRGGDAGGMEE